MRDGGAAVSPIPHKIQRQASKSWVVVHDTFSSISTKLTAD
jgi:hypothetical protein